MFVEVLEYPLRLGNPGPSPGQSLRHQMLLQQYQQCLQRSRMQPFSAYALNDARALDIR